MMLREKSILISRLHILVDLVLTTSAFVTAYLIKSSLLPPGLKGLTTAPNYYTILLLILLIWYPCLRYHDVHSSKRYKPIATICWDVLKAVSCGMLLLTLAMYVMKITDVSRIMLGIFFVLNLVFLWCGKSVAYCVLRRYRSRGMNSRNIIVVGTGASAVSVIEAVKYEHWAGYKILGCLNADIKRVGEEITKGIRIIGIYDEIEKILSKDVVDEIVFATDLNLIPNIQNHIELAEEIGIDVRVLPQWNIRRLGISPRIGVMHYEDFLGVPTLAIHTTPTFQGAIILKNIFDYTIAGTALILTLPIWLIAAVAIKIISPGPILYQQERIGRNGRRFLLFKFRTMVPGAEKMQPKLAVLNECDGPVFKIKNDPRVIPWVGTFLRKTGLDELPQFLNVLKGELSVVGPRPPLASEVECYELWQRRRLSMKPGITCLWQIQPKRNEISFGEWMKLDLQYIDKWSLGLDAKIMFKTVFAMARGEGR